MAKKRRPLNPFSTAGGFFSKLFVTPSEKLNAIRAKDCQLAYTVPWNLIGLQVSGDVGDETIYTDRFGQKVAFPKSPPDKPASELQIKQRLAFGDAQRSWKALSDEEKASLEQACRQLSMPLTGQNLWIHTILRKDTNALLTVEKQSGILLPTPP